MKKIFMFSATMLAMMNLSSCSNDEKDLYDPSKSEKETKDEFFNNFKAKYAGTYDAEQSWDLSNQLAVSYMTDPAYVRAEGDLNPQVTSSTGYDFNINSAFTPYMSGVVDDIHENDIKYFYEMPESGSLKITEVFQSGVKGGNNNFTLHVIVGTYPNAKDVTILSNNQGINNNKGQSKSYTLTGIPAGTPLAFYVNSHKGSAVSQYETLQGTLTEVISSQPVGEYNDGTVVGASSHLIVCKAATSSSGEDTNIAFLLDGIGERIEADKEITKITSKRYMIEDLGATDDFDFNDIVIDVTEVVKEKNGVVLETNQTAKLVHLGGTLPWNVKIGNTQLYTSMQPGELNVDKNVVMQISGWNPAENNIIVTVSESNNKGVYSIPFPKKGESPMIIATSLDVNWMGERVAIPSDWWYVPAM